jgi:hypothetical protein
MSGEVLSTAFFNTMIKEPGVYSFQLVEQFNGDKSVALISNRAALQVIPDK